MKTNPYAVLGILLLAAVAIALPITLQPSSTTRVEWINCPGDGGELQKTVTAGSYLMRVLKEDARMCWPGICDAGSATSGEPFQAGLAMQTEFGADVVLTCKSTNGTANVVFTRAQ